MRTVTGAASILHTASNSSLRNLSDVRKEHELRNISGLRNFLLSIGLLATAMLSGFASAQDHSRDTADAVHKADAAGNSSKDFDFLAGKWNVHFHVLLSRFSAAKKWVEYDGTERFEKLGDTSMGFDEFDAYCAQLQMRNSGKSLRLYNTKTHEWTIYQLNNEGMLDQPVVGGFSDRRGEFFGQDSYNDRPIYVRNVWLNL